eukprot:CAMPEP_0179022374 /NCGR_PEP_ID=MMETSP0796-20121207/6375_1 /TAXON_ID=73915 /ORGANISM="Pyrodinium bahamense, Strain pbaha01" /LENGTH=248 /DNA_ID=CAMNT_0020718239 /DNA_START=165 /DNA_END=912 /DNA_ORIENTATION=+
MGAAPPDFLRRVSHIAKAALPAPMAMPTSSAKIIWALSTLLGMGAGTGTGTVPADSSAMGVDCSVTTRSAKPSASTLTAQGMMAPAAAAAAAPGGTAAAGPAAARAAQPPAAAAAAAHRAPAAAAEAAARRLSTPLGACRPASASHNCAPHTALLTVSCAVASNCFVAAEAEAALKLSVVDTLSRKSAAAIESSVCPVVHVMLRMATLGSGSLTSFELWLLLWLLLVLKEYLPARKAAATTKATTSAF